MKISRKELRKIIAETVRISEGRNWDIKKRDKYSKTLGQAMRIASEKLRSEGKSTLYHTQIFNNDEADALREAIKAMGIDSDNFEIYHGKIGEDKFGKDEDVVRPWNVEFFDDGETYGFAYASYSDELFVDY